MPELQATNRMQNGFSFCHSDKAGSFLLIIIRMRLQEGCHRLNPTTFFLSHRHSLPDYIDIVRWQYQKSRVIRQGCLLLECIVDQAHISSTHSPGILLRLRDNLVKFVGAWFGLGIRVMLIQFSHYSYCVTVDNAITNAKG